MRLIQAEGTALHDILNATHTLWHDGLAPDAYERLWRAQLGTAWGRRHLRRVALADNGEVLASLKVYDFDAVLDGQPIGVCGLGAVFTQPAHRGRGHAATLIEEVLQQAAGRGQQLALLFSEIGFDYYARIGFSPVPSHDATFQVAPPPQRGAPATLVRAGVDGDYDAIVRLDRERAEPFRFHLRRDRDLIQYAITRQRLRAGLAPPGMRTLEFFVAEEGASAVAYVVLGVEAGAWTILECGDRDPTGARIGAMLQVLIAREPSHAAPEIVGRLPAGLVPPQMTVVGQRTPKGLMMVRTLGDVRLDRPLDERDVMYWLDDLF